MQTTLPSIVVRKSLPFAAAIPFQTGGEASSSSATFFPSAAETVQTTPPFRPS